MDTNLKDLLTQVRTEPFILWAGAGLSLYAGFPTGSEIAKYLNHRLGNELPDTAVLDQVASAYQSKYNRETLIEDIRKQFFSNPPTSRHYHSLLSSVPIFKTIITTNFDPLFEFAYGDSLAKICSMEDFPLLNTGKIELIKLHSDFSRPDKMVLTKEDYHRFIATDSKQLLYDVVKTELARNNVILIGYSFEDINTLLLHYDLVAQLGDKRKSWWMVCPGLKSYQIRELNSKNITVVDSTGEHFIESLKQTFDDNIVNDYRQKRISTPAFSKYLLNHDIVSIIKTTREGDKLVGIEGENQKPLMALVGFQFASNSDPSDRMNKLLQGRTFQNVQFTAGEVTKITKRVNGILLSEISDIEKIIISSTPELDEVVSLKYGNKRIENVSFQFFRSPTHAGIKIGFHNFSVTTEFETPLKTDVTSSVDITISEVYPSALAGYQIHSLMQYGMDRHNLTILRKKGRFKIGLYVKDEYRKKSGILMQHFEHLMEIEKFFKVRFSNIEVTREAIIAAENIYELIRGVSEDITPLKITFDRNKQDKKTLEMAAAKDSFDFVLEYTRTFDPIYDVQIPAGRYSIKIDDATMPNYEDYLDSKTEELEIISKSGQVQLKLLRPV